MEKGRGEGEKGKGDESQGEQNATNMHFVGLNTSKARSESASGEERETRNKRMRSAVTAGGRGRAEKTENHQNTDDRREETQEAMCRTRKDAETGSDMELALAPKESTQSEEENASLHHRQGSRATLKKKTVAREAREKYRTKKRKGRTARR